MPAADLKTDIKSNIAELARMLEPQPEADDGKKQDVGELVAAHLQNTLWPFLDGLVDAMKESEDEIDDHEAAIEELGEAVDDLTENRGSVLMPDDAAVFALPISLTLGLLDQLEKRAVPTAEQIMGLRQACDVATKKLAEVTINVDLDDDEDEDDDEGEED